MSRHKCHYKIVQSQSTLADSKHGNTQQNEMTLHNYCPRFQTWNTFKTISPSLWIPFVMLIRRKGGWTHTHEHIESTAKPSVSEA